MYVRRSRVQIPLQVRKLLIPPLHITNRKFPPLPSLISEPIQGVALGSTRDLVFLDDIFKR